jgi:23S rRNA U2552 (ribose-2'-O)-methylase RlmE/FtsJ
MSELTQKTHFCFNIHHGGIHWSRSNDTRTPEDILKTEEYSRIALFRFRMLRLETELTKEKLKIETIKKTLWDYYKKLINPYEYIHLNKTVTGLVVTPIATQVALHASNSHTVVPVSVGVTLGTHGIGIANHEPISRAYFKMWELLHDFPVAHRDKTSFRYAALAEGPGGFIEAFIHFRRCYAYGVKLDSMLSHGHIPGHDSIVNKTQENHDERINEYADEIIAITLCDDKKVQIPGWKKSNQILDTYKNQIKVSYGEDGTGNLYKKENIDYYCSLFCDKPADLVTADGGFDFSDDYSHQEHTLYRLLLSEVIVGLRILRKGGCMIIKVFDFMSDYTIELLYLITSLFHSVYITKPFTSRIMNSEKYIVACGYMEHIPVQGIASDTIDHYLLARRIEILRHLYLQFDTLTDESPIPTTTILRPYTIAPEFIDALEQCNIGYGIRQLTYLSKTFDLVERQVDSDTVNLLKKDQCVYAMAWCKKYEFPIYYKSKVIKEIDTYHYIPIF